MKRERKEKNLPMAQETSSTSPGLVVSRCPSLCTLRAVARSGGEGCHVVVVVIVIPLPTVVVPVVSLPVVVVPLSLPSLLSPSSSSSPRRSSSPYSSSPHRSSSPYSLSPRRRLLAPTTHPTSSGSQGWGRVLGCSSSFGCWVVPLPCLLISRCPSPPPSSWFVVVVVSSFR